MSKHKLLIISFSNHKSDPRVKRQINYFKDFYDITTVGLADSEIENVTHIDVFSPFNKINFIIPLPKLLLGMFESYYWNLEEIKLTLEKIKGKQFDVIIANDADALPVALKIKGNAKVIFDAHEYSPEENNDSLRWRILFKKYKTNLIQKYANKADFMLTVCDGIAKKYNSEFGLNPMVLTNAADYFENTNSMKVGDKIKIMHHGLALPQRKIENMIEMMDFVDERFELDLMLVFRKEEYKKELEQLIGTKKNVRLIPPVSTDEIVPFISKYDIGIYLLEPNNFNNKHALPNKFFEFIQGRLAIAIGPSPEMAKILTDFDLGLVSKDFDAKNLAETINSFNSDKIIYYKEKADLASKEFNSFENYLKLHEKIKSWIE
jgi:hypothetical protein